jgi:tetratricopeptide (TPR) repeat protein
MIALVLAGLANLCAPRQVDPWAQIWTELETLRSGKTSSTEADLLRRHLEDALRRAADGPRADLLDAGLKALSGRDVTAAAARLCARESGLFTTRELWLLADLSPNGPERARIVLTAMDAAGSLADWQVLLAWNVAVDEARALRLEETALPIQMRLHERYRAQWSAEDLALTYRFLGREKAAAQILEEAIRQERAAGRRPASLLEKRGIHALGFGDEAEARDYLGQALAEGAEDAGLLLARLDLLAGKTENARCGFQALLLKQPPADWAWRGWGAALLPEPFVPPTTMTLLPSQE